MGFISNQPLIKSGSNAPQVSTQSQPSVQYSQAAPKQVNMHMKSDNSSEPSLNWLDTMRVSSSVQMSIDQSKFSNLKNNYSKLADPSQIKNYAQIKGFQSTIKMSAVPTIDKPRNLFTQNPGYAMESIKEDNLQTFQENIMKKRYASFNIKTQADVPQALQVEEGDCDWLATEVIVKLEKRLTQAKLMDTLKEAAQSYSDQDRIEAEIGSAAAWNEVYKLDREIKDMKIKLSINKDIADGSDGPSVSGDLPSTFIIEAPVDENVLISPLKDGDIKN